MATTTLVGDADSAAGQIVPASFAKASAMTTALAVSGKRLTARMLLTDPDSTTKTTRMALIFAARQGSNTFVPMSEYDKVAVVRCAGQGGGIPKFIMVDPANRDNPVSGSRAAASDLSKGAARFSVTGYVSSLSNLVPTGCHVRGPARIEPTDNETTPYMVPAGAWVDENEGWNCSDKKIPTWAASNAAMAVGNFNGFTPEDKLLYKTTIDLGTDVLTGDPLTARQSPQYKNIYNMRMDAQSEMIRAAAAAGADTAKRCGINMSSASKLPARSMAEIRRAHRFNQDKIDADPDTAKIETCVLTFDAKTKGGAIFLGDKTEAEPTNAKVQFQAKMFQKMHAAFRHSDKWEMTREDCIEALKDVVITPTGGADPVPIFRYFGLLEPGTEYVRDDASLETLRTLVANLPYLEMGTFLEKTNPTRSAASDTLGAIVARRVVYESTQVCNTTVYDADKKPHKTKACVGSVYRPVTKMIYVPTVEANGQITWDHPSPELLMELLSAKHGFACVVAGEMEAYCYERNGNYTKVVNRMEHVYLLYALARKSKNAPMVVPVMPTGLSSDPRKFAKQLERMFGNADAEDDDDGITDDDLVNATDSTMSTASSAPSKTPESVKTTLTITGANVTSLSDNTRANPEIIVAGDTATFDPSNGEGYRAALDHIKSVSSDTGAPMDTTSDPTRKRKGQTTTSDDQPSAKRHKRAATPKS